jgi:lipoate-protein ligase B
MYLKPLLQPSIKIICFFDLFYNSLVNITSYHLGLIDYQTAYKLQRRLSEEIVKGRCKPSLLLLEHPHVYTFGRQGNPDNLLWNDSKLAAHGIKLQWTDRGGDVTYHGPGQLVGYPLLPLRANIDDPAAKPNWDITSYIRKLEQLLIDLLASYHIPAQRVADQTGVWVKTDPAAQPAKIASIGVRVDAHGITRHGFALNVAPNMAYWDGIMACGLDNQHKTSMAELLPQPPEMAEILKAVTHHFSRVFEANIHWADSDQILHLLDESV